MALKDQIYFLDFEWYEICKFMALCMSVWMSHKKLRAGDQSTSFLVRGFPMTQGQKKRFDFKNNCSEVRVAAMFKRLAQWYVEKGEKIPSGGIIIVPW